MIIKIPIYCQIEGKFTPSQTEEIIDQVTFLMEEDFKKILGKSRTFKWKLKLGIFSDSLIKEPLKFLTRQEVNEKLLPRKETKKDPFLKEEKRVILLQDAIRED